MRNPLIALSLGLALALSGCQPGGVPERGPGDGAGTDGGPAAVPPVATVDTGGPGEFTISGPYSHENLAVFLIHDRDRRSGKDLLTLQEAMEQKKVVVHETGDVNSLAIENVSGEEVYVQSGDIVKGGKQDRVFANDLVLAPKSGKVPIASFCVEQGRWTARGAEAVESFSLSSSRLATKELKLAAGYSKNQGQVWREVARTQGKLAEALGESVQPAASASSLQLTLENDRVRETTEAYVKALAAIIEGKADAVGMAFAVNGELNSADVYARASLFRKLFPKLLEASAVEAVANRGEGEAAKAPDGSAVRAWLTEASRGKATEKQVSDRVRVLTLEAEEDVFSETRDVASPSEWLHRNYIRR